MKTYNITTYRNQGKIWKRIRIMKDGVWLIDTQWKEGDLEAEAKAIRSADLVVIKNNLNLETRKLKKV